MLMSQLKVVGSPYPQEVPVIWVLARWSLGWILVALRDQDHFCPPLPLTMSPEMEACWGEGPLSGNVLRHKICSCFSEDFLDGIWKHSQCEGNPSAWSGISEYSKWNSSHSVPMGIVVYCHKGITSSRALWVCGNRFGKNWYNFQTVF
jgi:hypothetical protein